MSNDDFWVNQLSNEQIKSHAQNIKQDLGVERTRPVNVIRCLERGSILTVRGRKKLAYVVVPDKEMAENDAKTELIDDVVYVSVRQSVDQKARWGDGRSRMTLAHELAHAVLHPGSVKFRRVSAQGIADRGRIPAHSSAEHQAKVFASAFLIHDASAELMNNFEEISEQFIVSLEAARIAFENILEKRERASNAKKFLQMAEEFRKSVQGSPMHANRYIPDICSCGAQKLIPIGNKYHCDGCGRVSDHFQDGDQQN